MAVSVRSGAFRTYEHMPPCAALSGHYTEHHGWRDKAKYSPNPEHRWRPLAIGYPPSPCFLLRDLLWAFSPARPYCPCLPPEPAAHNPPFPAILATLRRFPP